ncbi:Nucleoside diphosphate kinase 5 [Nymphon striatum]|nr:Nucleoside diphosphate kinase 5 [Nymphon striatum]
MFQKKQLNLSKKQARQFYEEHSEKPFYNDLVEYMASGEIVALLLARRNAIMYWRQIIGPTKTSEAKQSHPKSIRAEFGKDDNQNGVHGSDSPESAEREIHFFFPDTTLEQSLNGLAAKDYLAEHVNPILLKGLTALCKEKPEDPIIWLADWLFANNPNGVTNGESIDEQ